VPDTFSELGVPASIVQTLARRGITKPFEIQTATIADALAGRDICGRAPTGSGKTLAFGIPLVVAVERAGHKRPHALVLAPTRELAEQISIELRTFAGPVRIGVVYGGVGYGPQLKALRQGIEILVACPGRLEDLIEQRSVDLSRVNFVVLDEADRMADMGFMPAVRRILDQTSDNRQTMLYSATLDGDVAKLTADYQRDPARYEVGSDTPDITAASHVFWKVHRAERTAMAAEAVSAAWPAIVFCRTRHGSEGLAKELSDAGIKSAAIHGGRSQYQRSRALADFAKGKVHALVASDVAARGIHVEGVASVIHYDPPDDYKTYMHRSGRTARAGKGGVVVSLVLPEQAGDIRRMQRRIGLDEAFITPDASALASMEPSVFHAPGTPSVHDRGGASAPRRGSHGRPSYVGRPSYAGRPSYEGSRAGSGSAKSYGDRDSGARWSTRRPGPKPWGRTNATNQAGRGNRRPGGAR
jgi:superfamily II DNA/RNA helicase